MLTGAVAAEDKFGWKEPSDWLLPERVRLGVAVLAAALAVEGKRQFDAAWLEADVTVGDDL